MTKALKSILPAALCLLMPDAVLHAADPLSSGLVPTVIVDTSREPVVPGKFQPTWASLEQYRVPDWFRDAKFGIWAHWGPQCEPEQGDWYARNMYMTGSAQNKFHIEHYGDPAVFGFKDVIHTWKAARWDPDKLVALYKRAGAQYFFAMANHHDNMDLWDSKYQPWNSVKVGPQKDLVAGWAKAARAQGLPFGLSVHAAHAWMWYEPSQKYDGNTTKADGAGKWWNGLDPQDLYAQNHALSSARRPHDFWDWAADKVTPPSQAYCNRFYDRTADLIKKYQPDLLYFDDTVLPLWPASDAGLKLAADFYNTHLARTGGKDPGVLFGKILDEQQRKCLVWDIERGVPGEGKPFAWQTDTCIGGWHYNRSLYDHDKYRGSRAVIQMLADIVSKNGNLLLNIPVRGDGTIDEKEEAILEGIAGWMDVNKEAIFGTRPWKVFGEGPASEAAALTAQGFNESKNKSFTAEDVRFTTKDGVLYAIALGVPKNALSIKSLGAKAGLAESAVADVTRLGSTEKVVWKQDDGALTIEPFRLKPASEAAVVYKIKLR